MRTDEMLKVQEAHDKLKAENERLRAALQAILHLDGSADLPDAWDIAGTALKQR